MLALGKQKQTLRNRSTFCAFFTKAVSGFPPPLKPISMVLVELGDIPQVNGCEMILLPYLFPGIVNPLKPLSVMHWIFQVKEDHALVVVELTASTQLLVPPRRGRSVKCYETDIANLQPDDLAKPFRISWSVDVHSHAHELEKHLLQQLPLTKRARKPFKNTMSDTTWSLVQSKKFWRNQMWEHERVQKDTWLRLCFIGWKTSAFSLDTSECRRLQQHQDHLCATAYWHFRRTGRQVVAALRRDGAIFFDDLAQQASELTHPHQAREFWRIIRRSLPKMKVRRQQISPMQLEHLEDQWHPYFQELEVGTPVSRHQLVRDCFHFQCAQTVAQKTCPLTAFPSRA